MTNARAQRANHHRATQLLVVLCLPVFFAFIAYGYTSMFASWGLFPAVVIGLLLASVACVLARVAGTGEGGFWHNWPFIVALWVVSGLSVYTTMMLTFEGGQIVSDTLTQSVETLQQLQDASEQALGADGAAARVNRINSLRDSLIAEIQNPVNCGQGPEATRLIAELKQDLPGFTPLSMPNLTCAKNDQVVAGYEARIAALIDRDPRNHANLWAVRQRSIGLRDELEKLRPQATTNYSPIRVPGIVSALESLDADYRAARYRASKEAAVSALPASLPIETVRSLGNAARLPNLIASRIDHPATITYLAAALLADLFMVYAFRRAKRREPQTVPAGLSRAFR